MAVLTVHAPLSGTIVALADVPDLVFAQEMVGPGIAINPDPHAVVRVLSPVTGRVGALFPHAFAVEADGGQVLVHLGLDTASLAGEPYEVAIARGQQIHQGDLAIQWHLEGIGALSPLVPVVALGASSVDLFHAPGTHVEAGARLLAIRS